MFLALRVRVNRYRYGCLLSFCPFLILRSLFLLRHNLRDDPSVWNSLRVPDNRLVLVSIAVENHGARPQANHSVVRGSFSL